MSSDARFAFFIVTAAAVGALVPVAMIAQLKSGQRNVDIGFERNA